MERPGSEDRLYTAGVLAFLIGLLALGILGVPALLVAGLGVAAAALAIAGFHRSLERRGRSSGRSYPRSGPVPAKYEPRVLERGSMRRRRGVHLRRRRDTAPPLRFR